MGIHGIGGIDGFGLGQGVLVGVMDIILIFMVSGDGAGQINNRHMDFMLLIIEDIIGIIL